MAPKKIWVVLPGGGVKGAFQAGFLKEFFTNHPDMEVDRVYGTSIGAIISPFVATRRFDDVIAFFKTITCATDVFSEWSLIEGKFPQISVLFRGASYKKIGIIDQIKNKMSVYGDDSFYTKCHVVTWDIMNKKETWFSGRSVLYDGMTASASLPLAVPPHSFNNTFYVDGYVTELIPIGKISEDLIRCDYKDDVHVLIVDCGTRIPTPIKSLPTNGFSLMAEVMSDCCLHSANEEVADFIAMHKNTSYIKPDAMRFTSALDFSQSAILLAIQDGIDKAKDIKII